MQIETVSAKRSLYRDL